MTQHRTRIGVPAVRFHARPGYFVGRDRRKPITAENNEMLTKLSTVIFFTIFLTGCGGNPLQANRLAVTNRLRQACNSLTDAQIQAIIDARENDRIAGFTKAEVLNANFAVCGPFGSDCLVCANAVVNQVYGF